MNKGLWVGLLGNNYQLSSQANLPKKNKYIPILVACPARANQQGKITRHFILSNDTKRGKGASRKE